MNERHSVVFPTRVRRRAFRHAFEDVLEEVRENGVQLELALDGPGHWGSPNGFHSALEGLATLAHPRTAPARRSFASAYEAEADPGQAPRLTRPRDAAEHVLEAVKKGLSKRDLRALRRRFAAQHHPDRVPPELRDEAERAMSLVNAEIDAALARLTTAP